MVKKSSSGVRFLGQIPILPLKTPVALTKSLTSLSLSFLLCKTAFVRLAGTRYCFEALHELIHFVFTAACEVGTVMMTI